MYTVLIKSLVVVLIVSVFGVAVADTTATPSQLLAHPNTFNGQHVSVTGTVSDVVAKTSHAGNPYETFNLCDANSVCVHVFTFGQPSLSEGEKKTVRGTFSAVKHVGSYTFYDEIEADENSL
jgi:hypothetical protein